MQLTILLESDFNQALIDLMSGGIQTEYVRKGIFTTIGIASIIAPIFFFIAFGWNFLGNAISTAAGKKQSVFNWEEFFRTLAILLIIQAYYPIQYTLVKAVGVINNLSLPGEDNQAAFNSYLQEYENMKYIEESDLNILFSSVKSSDAKESEVELTTGLLSQNPEALNYLENKTNNNGIKSIADLSPKETEELLEQIELAKAKDDSGWQTSDDGKKKDKTMVRRIMQAFIGFLSKIIRGIIGFLAITLTKILLIIGPLAFAFSILPMFRDKLAQWFSTLLTVMFTITTINLIDILRMEYFEAVSSQTGVANVFNNVAMDVGIVIAYLMTFWITSKFVGSADAGKFISKTVTMATMAAAMGAKKLGDSLGNRSRNKAIKGLAGNLAEGASGYINSQSGIGGKA